MSDPLLPAAAGISAVIVALIGVEPQTLFWALVGCGLCSPATPKSGLGRGVLTFVMAMLASALLGTFLAAIYFAANLQLATKVCSLVLGLVFHPLMAAVVTSIPSIWDGILKRIGIKP